ncbi:hypothetical protein KFK09_022923 [Dendrobium nobile]|uniref:Uncharacterized protein n=1 Tax=Dendrobium nobile TaxID=94219 RepID=A0A8T3AK41_DENNO|nr:hypothetical protein KFK09_022923 [Dendrobium nobile]
MEAQPTSHAARTADQARPDSSFEEPTAAASANLTSLCRLSTVLAVTAISLWANYEASKGFDITVLEAPGATLAARQYNLMFVSNGGAARAILNASASIEQTLYPDTKHFPYKPINSVTLRVSDHNLTRAIIVTTAAGGGGDYLILVSPNVIAERDAEKAVVAVVYEGMARVWVRDGRGMAPAAVVDALVGYICGAAGFGREADYANEAAEGCEATAGFVRYCEEKRPGFVARLNKAMEEKWDNGIWDSALGISGRVVCSGFRARLGWVPERVVNSTGTMVELLQSD